MKLIVFTVVAGIAALGCWSGYAAIGSSVAADGQLVEPFALIPLGYLFSLLCGGGLVALCYRKFAAR